ncbi:MAG: type 4a pilus biogenesis protein PilO [Gammaproteobacteria bacterium]|nr:type 4a pilus biogenesis protein PilO [Gammaproteobacteria bacterium]
MNLSDLNNLNLDPNNVGSWPMAAKAIVILLLCAAILFAGYYLDTSDQLVTLEKSQAKEVSLKKTFETKQSKAKNLEAYKAQMVEMERSFGALLQQLPGKTEVPGLLDDISRIGVQSGLEFEFFKPEAEIPKDFYAELPIGLRVKGNYHQFGNFVSGTAALPRIVTLHDFTISAGKKGSDGMVMEATAKTYRYLEKSETTNNERKRARKGKK